MIHWAGSKTEIGNPLRDGQNNNVVERVCQQREEEVHFSCVLQALTDCMCYVCQNAQQIDDREMTVPARLAA